jgi:type 1 fimbriae regulatory protein FimB/type 1 fimbriae regulatory protein FimE
MKKLNLALVAPATKNGTVTKRRPPKRRPNSEVRAREYLTNTEVEQLIKAAGANRHGHRDATMILLAYRHGLRVSELVGLRWDLVDFAHGRLHVNRAKNGSPSVHPFSGREMRALRRLRRDQRPE